jgi:hypothetical protein
VFALTISNPQQVSARPAACPQFEKLARSIGWPKAEIGRLSYVLARESSCFPRAWNREDVYTGSYGISQINGSWKLALKRAGFIRKEMTELFNPTKNLKAALWIFNQSGWAPWGFKTKGK